MVIINLSVLLYIGHGLTLFCMSDGSSINEPTKVKTTMLLPKDLVKQLKQHALDNDTTVTALVIEACIKYLGRKGK
jgi:hypothetical protein